MLLRCGRAWWNSSTYQCQRRTQQGLKECPPCRKPCAAWPAACGVRKGGGDTTSLGWGSGASRPYSQGWMQPWRRPLRTWMQTPTSWMCWSSRCTTVDAPLGTSCHLSGTMSSSELPSKWAAPRGPRCLPVGGIGKWGVPCGGTQSRRFLLGGGWLGRICGREGREHCWAGWMRIPTTTCRGAALHAASHPGMSVQLACRLFARPAWLSWGGWGPSAAKTPWMGMQCDSTCCRSGWGRTLRHSSGHCLDWHLDAGSRSGLLALLCGVTAWGMVGTPIQCMEDDVRESGTSASSSGLKHRPDDQGWSPLTALEIITANKVADWRMKNNMNEDSDFAFRWSSHTQAVTEAGHAVAHAWLQVRSQQQDLLWPAAAKMVDELPKPAPSQAPRLQPAFYGPKSKKRRALQRRSAGRLRANPTDSPHAIQTRVQALADVLQQLGAIRPSGRMSSQLQTEWSGSCIRLAQRLVTAAEPITVLNALKTYQELNEYMDKRERRGEPERVDLDSFLHSSSTSAPSRALNSIKWLNKHGKLDWDVGDLSCPSSTRPRRKKGQASVISPPMLMFLEEQAEQMCRSGDDRWSCLLGSWMVATGCMRYRHLTRSSPRRVSMSTFHASCSRGKQRASRKGFDLALPGDNSLPASPGLSNG